MDLYRVVTRWANDRIALSPGAVVELSPDEVAQVLTDCPGGMVALSVDEAATVRAGLAAMGLTHASFRPPAPDRSGAGRGAGEGAMSTANMTGLTTG